METLVIYLAKSAVLLSVFYLTYHLMLRKETFFRGNRWYLLIGLVTSLLLPMVTFTRTILVDAMPIPADEWVALPMEPVYMEAAESETNWLQLALVAYLTGVSIFLARFASDLFALRKILKDKRICRQHGYRFVDTLERVSPFSFFNYIVYNSTMYSSSELENIIEHEKAHSDDKHTFDILLTRLVCILMWFNPFAWLYRKAVAQNLEYIADSEATKRLEDKRSYQLTLLKITTHEGCVAISNQFYQSLIKKRIVMLNKSKSRKRNSWKYATILPALGFFLLYFQVEVVAQEKVSDTLKQEKHKIAVRLAHPGDEVLVDKKTTDSQLKAYADDMKKRHGVTLKFSKVKRNSNGEITGIKAEYKDPTGKKGATAVSGNDPIAPIRFFKGNGTVGFAATPSHRIMSVPDVPAFDIDTDAIVDVVVPEPPFVDGVPAVPGVPQIKVHPRGSHVFMRRENDRDPIVIVDGKVITGDEALKYDFKIDDIDVIVDSKKISAETREKVRESMEKVREELEKQRGEMRVIRSKHMNEEMEKARKEIEAARDEIKKAREEIIRAREEMKEKAKK